MHLNKKKTEILKNPEESSEKESISDNESMSKYERETTNVYCLTNDTNISNDKDTKKESNVVFASLFFVILAAVLALIYIRLLSPSDNDINSIVLKFETGTYKIPKYVAEKYLIWYGMRTFFFGLHYFLTIFGIIASLMTVFYASSNKKGGQNSKIVFLSLLSLSFSMSNVFINAGSQANMSQHVWRELDICIMDTILDEELSNKDRDQIIIEKIAEMERYIETFEH